MRGERVRDLRLRCWLEHGGDELPGVTVTVGARSGSLRLERASGLEEHARCPVTIRLPDGDGTLRLVAEILWTRDEDRDLVVGVTWAQPGPAARETLEGLVASHRHTVVALSSSAAERDRLARVLSPAHHVVAVAGVDEALAAFADHAVSVLVVGRAIDDPVAALRALDPALGAALAMPLVLASHPEGTPADFVDVGRIFGVLGRPLQDEMVQQLVHRCAGLHELVVENDRLGVELERTRARLQRENAYLRRRLTGVAGFETIIGSSPALRRSLDEIARVRRTDATVHIQGETGTGKELVARALHEGGRRAAGPFVAQSCAGIPEGLLLSTLFGHVKGAFTGAERAHAGVFQEAHGGTLFLDEVAELSPAVQASVLRALQQREVVPVGASRPVPIDVRLVSATHKDLREEVRAGRFREDLYYRLMVVGLRLPPLRERQGDVALLAQHFLDLHCTRHGKRLRGFTPEAVRVLEAHGWPGNVRELENEVERAVVLADDDGLVEPRLLSETLRGRRAEPPPPDPVRDAGGVLVAHDTPYDEAVRRIEHALVARALELANGNLTHAARRLGIKRTRLFKIRERLGLTRDEP
jgi:transcriptional regulator with GAF, ATPase, and Fis domain